MKMMNSLGDFGVRPSTLARREFLIGAGAAGMALAASTISRLAPRARPKVGLHAPHHPVSLELAPGKVIKTFGYNGTAPGPVLRLREGRQVSFEISNETDVDDIVHWHGLYVPSEVDGVDGRGHAGGAARRHAALHLHAEARGHALVSQPQLRREGSVPQYLFRHVRVSASSNPPQIPASTTKRCSSRRIIGRDLGSACRTFERDRLPTMVSRSCTRRHRSTTARSAMASRCGCAKVNASSSGCSMRAPPRTSGWRSPGIASRCSRSTAIRCRRRGRSTCLSLGVAERVDAVVEMSRPGVWILGEVDDDVRRMGLGVVVEYADQHGEPQWSEPAKSVWDYTAFGA